MKKIDCHCHIVNTKIMDEYFSRTDSYAIVMQFLDKFKSEFIKCDAYKTVKSDSRLFLCPCIDISADIPLQLAQIEKKLKEYRIVGIKIYLTYQRGRADDQRMFPIYDFARKHGLTVTYHTGSCALTLPSDNDLDGSNARYVENVARKYPDVNFVVAHMDDPRYTECIKIVHENDNMFTDFSGAYEPGTPEGDSIDWAVDTFKGAIDPFPDIYKKILYGTDFCPPINLSALEEYDYTIEKIFEREHFEDIYYKNCLRAFPLLSCYIKGE